MDHEPDRDLVRRWELALTEIAARETADRGITEPTSVNGGAQQLMANYGPMSVVLTGPAAEVTDEAELFETIDRWLVFDRGVDELLDRDRAFVTAWRAEIPAAIARWQECADLVAGDVARTTELPGAWRVEVREDEDALLASLRRRRPTPEAGHPYASGLHFRFAKPRERGRVPLLLPEIWLVAPGITEMQLPVAVVDIADGAAEIAERAQDEVIDTIWGGWPVCPGHGHPAEPWGSAWVCPAERHPIAAIGRLGL